MNRLTRLFISIAALGCVIQLHAADPVLKAAAPEFYVRLVRASEGKRARAEPIAALYAQGRVKHVSAFPDLEDQMCAFGAEGYGESPDRLDALVWALTDLLLGGAMAPRARIL